MRDRFSNRLGFILISAGCAIELAMYGAFHILLDNMVELPLS